MSALDPPPKMSLPFMFPDQILCHIIKPHCNVTMIQSVQLLTPPDNLAHSLTYVSRNEP